ncbi:MAG: right-handed parallel beta-helix repeat-containing protein [Prosthecobacter sp.]
MKTSKCFWLSIATIAFSASLFAADSFEVRVPAPGPDVIADTLLQEAIDKVAAAGGGVVLLGLGDFKLSRKAGDETVVIKSNVTLRGQGHATHIYLDPATPPNPVRYYPMRIGTASVPASNVVIENLRYTGNDAAIGGGSIMGFNARLDDPAGLLLSCDNVTIRHCWIHDAKQAAGCTKPASNYPSEERQAAQHKNWQVHHNYIHTCGNKAVEFAECNGGLIADNHIVNVTDGPQVIFGSRNIQIRDNTVFFTRSGINITEGSHHIRVSGNHVEPMPEINPKTVGPCLVFRTEPQVLDTVVSDVVVTGNIFRNQLTQSRCVLRFETRPEALSCTYQSITITGNEFDGDACLVDKTKPAATTLQDILFADNMCQGDVVSVPDATMASRRVVLRGNMLRKPGNIRLNASQWIWSGNTHTQGALQVTADAKANVILQNITTAPIIDNGVETQMNGNIVMKQSAHQ